MRYLNMFLLFLALTFNSESDCRGWLASFEARWNPTNPAWRYDEPHLLKDGRYFVYIIPSAEKYLTEAERAACVELSESDLPDPPPLPE